VTTSA